MNRYSLIYKGNQKDLTPSIECRPCGRTKALSPADRPVRRLIQHDAVINDGNSNRTLVNSKCTVLGINTWKIARGGSQGIFFSLQMNQLKNEIDHNVPNAVWE